MKNKEKVKKSLTIITAVIIICGIILGMCVVTQIMVQFDSGSYIVDGSDMSDLMFLLFAIYAIGKGTIIFIFAIAIALLIWAIYGIINLIQTKLKQNDNTIKHNKKIIISLVVILVIIILAIMLVIFCKANKNIDTNTGKEIAYDVKITYKWGIPPTTGYGTITEYILVNIDTKKAYFINNTCIFGDTTGKNGNYYEIVGEKSISGNTLEMILGLTRKESDYDKSNILTLNNNYYLVEYKDKKIELTATPLLKSLFNSIKNKN